jgi:1-acyl-sn-glycerol-3-phosphate acyltransferase
MLAVRSLAFNVAFFTWSVLMQLLALPLLLAPPRMMLSVGRLWTRGTTWLLRHLIGLDHEIRGRENLPDGPFLVAAKHQSAWDTLIFCRLLANPTYVLKRELTWVPLFGWYLKHYGMVAVDRKGGAKALRRMLHDAQDQVGRGRTLIIFPEGTRTPPGKDRPYHPGVAALYRELALPVVPVALNSGLFWGRRAFRKHPGRIVLEFLPPIPPGLSRRDFMRRLHDDLESASTRLLVEAKGVGQR